MKAIVYTQYGPPDVLHIKEVPTPTQKDNEVLVKTHATSVTFGDLLARNFKQVSPRQFSMPTPLWLPTRVALGFNKPKQQILGSEFSGVIEAVGKDVTRFKVGDAVFGYRAMAFGANAEYMTMPEDGFITTKPAHITYEEAATIPYGALTALNLLRKVKVEKGQKVLIMGASGAIGSYALQLFKQYGAEVTAVCGARRFEFVKALGADKVIDYKTEDFTTNGKQYDIIFDVLGKETFSRVKESLTQNGVYMLASFKTGKLLQMLWTSRFSSKKVICALSSERPKDLITVKEWVETGKIKSIVDRCFSMEQAAEAHRYAESGNKQGHVVIMIAQPNHN